MAHSEYFVWLGIFSVGSFTLLADKFGRGSFGKSAGVVSFNQLLFRFTEYVKNSVVENPFTINHTKCYYKIPISLLLKITHNMFLQKYAFNFGCIKTVKYSWIVLICTLSIVS